MASSVSTSSGNHLRSYYFTRAIVAAAWVGAAFALGTRSPAIAAALLVAYPAWDALANVVDARRSGGFAQNPTQALNFFVSLATAIGVALALGRGYGPVYIVFGLWAGFAGLLQLGTAVRRWKSFGAQWAMILSGAQSVLAGGFMLKQAGNAMPDGIADIAPYAAFGAFYFLVSAVWLTVSDARRRAKTISV